MNMGTMTTSTPAIRALSMLDVPTIKKFTDRWIGQNYFSVPELEQILQLSVARSHENSSQQLTASLGAFLDGEMIAVRLSFAPGAWIKKVGRGLTPEIWQQRFGLRPEDVAYFKSLFVAEQHQQLGLGKTLSLESIELLKKMGAKAILCHSWLESPGNSSQLYLQKMGFQDVSKHPLFWNHIDYDCTRCAPDRCQCTAMEMIKIL